MYSVVREGRLVWPYCTECGCRLDMYHDDELIGLEHFVYLSDNDARGHYCSLVENRVSVEYNIIKHVYT